MILKSIEMSNFRNYEREEFHFHEGTNVLYGDNAQEHLYLKSGWNIS